MKMRQLLVDLVKDNNEVLSPYVLSITIDLHLAHLKYDRIWETQVKLQAEWLHWSWQSCRARQHALVK